MSYADLRARREYRVPDDGKWVLLNHDRKAIDLYYAHVETCEVIVVLAYSFNQPVAWRIERLLAHAKDTDRWVAEMRKKISEGDTSYTEETICYWEQVAASTRETVQQMRDTGKVLG